MNNHETLIWDRWAKWSFFVTDRQTDRQNIPIIYRWQENLAQKYSHLITDITGYNCTVNSFEVSSTGFINKRNKSTLLTLHKFMKQDIKKSTFLSNLNSLARYGSYKSWLTRDDPTFADPPFLIPHLKWIPSISTSRHWYNKHRLPISCPGPRSFCSLTHYLDNLVVPPSLCIIKMNSLYVLLTKWNVIKSYLNLG